MFQINPLGLSHPAATLLPGWGGQNRGIMSKGRLLQIPVGNALRSSNHPAVRVGRVFPNAGRLQRRRIHHPHVPRRVRNDNGIDKRGLVQYFPGGMLFFFQKIMIVAESTDPISVGKPPVPAKGAYFFHDFLEISGVGKGHGFQSCRQHGEMTVAVEKSGCQDVSL